MKKLSKKSALAQLTKLYCVVCSDKSMFSVFAGRLCSCYAWSCSFQIKQIDIDLLRSDIIIYINEHFSDFSLDDLNLFSLFLGLDFDV